MNAKEAIEIQKETEIFLQNNRRDLANELLERMMTEKQREQYKSYIDKEVWKPLINDSIIYVLLAGLLSACASYAAYVKATGAGHPWDAVFLGMAIVLSGVSVYFIHISVEYSHQSLQEKIIRYGLDLLRDYER